MFVLVLWHYSGEEGSSEILWHANSLLSVLLKVWLFLPKLSPLLTKHLYGLSSSCELLGSHRVKLTWKSIIYSFKFFIFVWKECSVFVDISNVVIEINTSCETVYMQCSFLCPQFMYTHTRDNIHIQKAEEYINCWNIARKSWIHLLPDIE